MDGKWKVGMWSPGNLCVIEWTALPEPPFFAANYRKVAEVYEQADVPKLAAAKEMYELLECLPSDIRHLRQSGNPDMCQRIIAKIDAVLKKARGEA